MRLLRHDLHSLSGAYVLDALEPGAERDRFTRHLSRCQSCASEVRGFREVATAMAFAATAEPPAGLRDQVLAAAARTRQLPPGKVYQLWLIGKPAITSAGLLPPAKDGQTPPVLATGVVKGDTLGLTVEPAGGSAQPTTKPILALPLPV